MSSKQNAEADGCVFLLLWVGFSVIPIGWIVGQHEIGDKGLRDVLGISSVVIILFISYIISLYLATPVKTSTIPNQEDNSVNPSLPDLAVESVIASMPNDKSEESNDTMLNVESHSQRTQIFISYSRQRVVRKTAKAFKTICEKSKVSDF